VRAVHAGKLSPPDAATKDAPIDAVIVGIVDTIEVDGKILEKP
jgi:microcompartment protein CcmK/EutM